MSSIARALSIAVLGAIVALSARETEGGKKLQDDDFKPVGPPPPPPAHLIAPPTDEVFYDSPIGAGIGTYRQIVIREKGNFSSVRLTANLPPQQEMGFFRMIPSDADVDRVRAVVRASNFAQYGHRGPMRPDTPTTMLSWGTATSTFLPGALLPPPVTKVFETLDELAREIEKHPFKVVRGEAKWTTPQIKRGHHVELTVVLRSVGSQVIVIDNPLGSPSPTWVGLRLTVSKDKPPAELDWEKDVIQIDLVPQNLLTADGKLAKGLSPRIELLPGAELRLQVRRKLLLSAGRYRAHLTFIAASDDRDGKVVGGALTMELDPLTVEH